MPEGEKKEKCGKKIKQKDCSFYSCVTLTIIFYRCAKEIKNTPRVVVYLTLSVQTGTAAGRVVTAEPLEPQERIQAAPRHPSPSIISC